MVKLEVLATIIVIGFLISPIVDVVLVYKLKKANNIIKSLQIEGKENTNGSNC